MQNEITKNEGLIEQINTIMESNNNSSNKIISSGFVYSNRAKAIRCNCPPDNPSPSLDMIVSTPFFIFFIHFHDRCAAS